MDGRAIGSRQQATVSEGGESIRLNATRELVATLICQGSRILQSINALKNAGFHESDLVIDHLKQARQLIEIQLGDLAAPRQTSMSEATVKVVAQISTAIALVVCVFSTTARAADYYVYKDAAGRTVLSNQTPPPGATIVKRYDWADASHAEIAATERANREISRINATRELVESNKRLAAEMRMAREQGAPQVHVEVNSVDAASATAVVSPRRHGEHRGGKR